MGGVDGDVFLAREYYSSIIVLLLFYHSSGTILEKVVGATQQGVKQDVPEMARTHKFGQASRAKQS